MSSGVVKRVLAGQLCTGCGLCASVAADAIRMSVIDPGYRRPKVVSNVPSEAEHIIAACCPGAIVEPWGDDLNTHPFWGPYRLVATGHATDPRQRFEASSGGALSAVAIHALQVGLVDRVVHVSADPEHPTRNVMTCSQTPEEVLAGAGSRYAASSPLEQIQQLLSEGRRFAFVGKPCDASALRRLGRLDKRVDALSPLILSFFCGGLPSHAGADRVVEAMGLSPSQLSEFRYRGMGWPGKARAVTRDGVVGEMSYAESWGGYLSKQVQFRCKICPDAVGGVADLAFADAWHGDEDGYPRFEETDGRSLIVARTARGLEILTSALEAGAVKFEALPVEEIDGMQPAQARRKRLVASRLMALIATAQPRPSVTGLRLGEAARRAPASEQFRSFVGSVRRILTGVR